MDIQIVTVFLRLNERLLPRSIHSVTSQGFELKVVFFVVVTSINQYEPTQNILI